MTSNSKTVQSNQQGIHENLETLVKRHLLSNYRKPIQRHNQQAFQHFLSQTETIKQPRILDSCCGTGQSTIELAKRYPDHWVIGIDQSEHRLSRVVEQPKNLLLLQANCEDFWRLCVEASIRFEHHYILYPNPWPKKIHLKRRWHGHPVFPYLAKLSEDLTLRSNWPIYLEEFAESWFWLTGKRYSVESYEPENFMTLFEKKYALSGQALYQLKINAK